MPNETIGLHSRYYDPPPFLSGLSSDLPTEDSLHRSRVFVIVVGSSYTSHLGIIEDPSARDNKKTPEGAYAGCVVLRKNYGYVGWKWKLSSVYIQQMCAGETEMFC